MSKIKSNWTRLIIFFTLLIGYCIPFAAPIAFFAPDFLSKQRLENSTTYEVYLAHTLSLVVSLIATSLTINHVVRKIEAKSLVSIKLTGNVNELFKGFGWGAAIMGVYTALVLITQTAHFHYSGISIYILWGFALHLVVGITEEVIMRGYIMNNLLEKMNKRHALLVSSLVFACVHLPNDHITWIGFTNIFLSGILLGIAYLKSESISFPIGIHWAWNFFQGPVAGYHVSGNSETGVFEAQPTSADYLSGGPFGAEGSVLLIVVTLAAIAYCLKMRTRDAWLL